MISLGWPTFKGKQGGACVCVFRFRFQLPASHPNLLTLPGNPILSCTLLQRVASGIQRFLVVETLDALCHMVADRNFHSNYQPHSTC